MNEIIEQAQPFLIGPVSLVPLILFITQAVKEFDLLDGKALRALAIALGVVLLPLAQVIERGLLGADAVLIAEIAATTLWGVFGPSGIYSLGKQYFEKADQPAT
jgi:hypothetical protein